MRPPAGMLGPVRDGEIGDEGRGKAGQRAPRLLPERDQQHGENGKENNIVRPRHEGEEEQDRRRHFAAAHIGIEPAEEQRRAQQIRRRGARRLAEIGHDQHRADDRRQRQRAFRPQPEQRDRAEQQHREHLQTTRIASTGDITELIVDRISA